MIMQTPNRKNLHFQGTIRFYTCKDNPQLKFATLAIGWGSQHLTSIRQTFIPKGDYWKISKFVKRNFSSSSASLETQKPTLEDSLINDVINNSINFLKFRKQAKKFGVSMNRGLLFTGSPGNGKTMLTRYIRDLAQKEGFTCSIFTTSDINYSFSQESLEDMLYDPSDIVIFDDINIEYLSRKEKGADVACSLLSALDGVKKSENTCVRIFSTNEDVQDIDPAFLRPGRIDKTFRFEKPTKLLRNKFVNNFHDEIKKQLDIDSIIERTQNFSFAELESFKTQLVTNYLIKNSYILYPYISW
jgi:SpoVK/Ycf46/Vps4 family AAA+-type ATPase